MKMHTKTFQFIAFYKLWLILNIYLLGSMKQMNQLEFMMEVDIQYFVCFFRICQRRSNTCLLAKMVRISHYHKYVVALLRIQLTFLYRIIIFSLTKDISKFFEKASKKRDLCDQSKTCEDPKKMRDDKSSIGSLTDIADDVFAECLKSPE